MRRLMLKLVFGLTSLLLAATASHAAGKPNFVLFLGDDLGWGELTCQGFTKEIPTPHIDSIASNGVRFTNGYVAATYCSPSRAGLMTGRYPTRYGHEFNGRGAGFGLPLTEKTLPALLKAAGYSTACVGKWHLGDTEGYYPTQRGFDEFYGTLANTPFFKPSQFVDSRKGLDIIQTVPEGFYLTDALADRAVDWLDRHKDKPFFLYLPFNAQHAPLEATQKYLDRFPNIADKNRRTFAGMLSAMDDAVGRVIQKVRDMGQESNTIIVYLADNGGPTQSTTSQNGPLRGFKMTTNEGGTRVPFMIQWKGTLPAGRTYDHPVLNLDMLPTFLAAAGAPIDPAWKLDGKDLMPYLTGKTSDLPHQTLYWRYGQQWAVRHGDWKLVASRIDNNQPRLINLAADLGEAKDLATSEPQKLAELNALYKAWDAQQMAPKWGEGATKTTKKKKKAASK
jgi:arylsulfatase A-like enzyme